MEVAKPASGPKGGRFETEQLWGAAAIKHTYDDLAEKMANAEASVDLRSLKPLNQFIWLLDAPQCEKVQEWVSTLAKRFKSVGGRLSIADGEEGAASSSSTTLVAQTAMSADADAAGSSKARRGTTTKKQPSPQRKPLIRKRR